MNQCYTVQDATLILVHDKPYKVVLDGGIVNGGTGSKEFVRSELQSLEDVGVFGEAIVQCRTIQVIQPNTA